jgi:hypothetical protein
MERAIVGTALLLSLAVASLAQQVPSLPSACSQGEVNRTAAQVHSARKRLLDLPIGDGLETNVSPAAQQDITFMKDALSLFVNAYMRCVSNKPDSAKIQQELSTLSDAFEMPRGRVIPNGQLPPDFGKYGFELSFEVKVIENPRLVGVTANFSIECGGDTVLLIFAPDNESWKEVLRWQKKPYATVDGGTLAFDYGISPPDERGQWYIVTHDVAPWCSSTWSSIRYTVLRPTDEPLRPKILLSASDGMWFGNEDFGSLTVQKNAFDLRFHSYSIDTGVHNRVWIRHYSVIGDTVHRIQPVAVSPRDFVDEWVESPWEQAALWSSTSAIGNLRKVHETLSKLREATNSLLEYDSVYACSESADRYQVEVSEEVEPDFKTARTFYFQVLGRSTYTMVRASKERDPNCAGRNLLEEMSTK